MSKVNTGLFKIGDNWFANYNYKIKSKEVEESGDPVLRKGDRVKVIEEDLNTFSYGVIVDVTISPNLVRVVYIDELASSVGMALTHTTIKGNSFELRVVPLSDDDEDHLSKSLEDVDVLAELKAHENSDERVKAAYRDANLRLRVERAIFAQNINPKRENKVPYLGMQSFMIDISELTKKLNP